MFHTKLRLIVEINGCIRKAAVIMARLSNRIWEAKMVTKDTNMRSL